MSKLIDDAVRVLRDLPEDVQQAAARAIIDYGAWYNDDVQLSDAAQQSHSMHVAHG